MGQQLTRYLEQLVDDFKHVTNREEAFAKACSAAAALGFPYAIHAPVQGHPEAEKNWVATTYPSEWQRMYAERGYVTRNPVRRKVLQTARPFTWSALENSLPANQRMIFAESRDIGMPDGIVVPVHAPGGQAIAVGFACDHADAVSDQAMLALHMLAVRLHDWMDAHDTSAIRLTPREREVLQWLATGAGSSDIGDRLGISSNSVEWHLKNIFAKLQVRTRTAAAVKAIRLGLLDMGAL